VDARDLYGLALDRFIPERTALAKELRGQGDRNEAARVAKLAKPSVAAWAVNQLVRTQARDVSSLFDAGDALQRAQLDVMAGRGSASALRAAGESERAAVTALTQTAGGLLTSDGHSLTPTTLERISDTLHAAALDREARAEVEGGCLTRELRHIGLGAMAVAEPAGASAPAKPTATARTGAGQRGAKTRRAQDEQRRADAERLERERERAHQRKRAEKTEAEARRAADRTQRELQTMQERRDRAAQTLREAEEALTAAQERAERDARAHTEAVQALKELN
jgi:hypothetical protein